MARPRLDLADRIAAHVTVTDDGCWLWTGTKNRNGYGRMAIREDGQVRRVAAHRIAYETFVGPIPADLVLDHLCRVRACCNPQHVEPVTLAENVLRSEATIASINAAKKHCPQGHEYVTRIRNGRPQRACRICERAV